MVGKETSVATAIEVDHNQLKELMKLYYKAKLALFCWGPTGIGKSQTVRQASRELAKEYDLEYTDDITRINDEKAFVVIDIRLAQGDPSDLRGIPTPDPEKLVTMWLPPELFPKKGRGIIFFDEMNQAPPLVQASAFQLILDRKLGTYVVPEGYVLMAAGNRLEDRANVYKMPAPLENRFGHCQLRIPDVEGWTEWAIEKEIDIRIIGFLNFRRGALFAFDPNNKEAAFATPRAWEHCSRLIKEIPSEDLGRLQRITATQVGVGIAGEFTQFIRVRERLKPLKYYLDNPDHCDLPNEEREIDLTWALVTSLAEYYKSHTETETLEKIIKILKRMSEEYAIFTLKLMITIDRMLTRKIVKIPDGEKLAKKLVAFFETN